MNTKLKVVLSVAVVIAIAGSYIFPRPTERVVERQLGALTGPDLVSDYLSVSGLRHSYRSVYFPGTATSTPCILRAPMEATSTLVFTSLTINVATSTATTWTVAKATGINATTTVLTTFPALASGAQGTMVATTTPGTLVAGSTPKPDIDTNVTFAPGQFVVWGVAGLTYTGYDATKLGGICKAEFIVNSI